MITQKKGKVQNVFGLSDIRLIRFIEYHSVHLGYLW